MKRVFLSLFLFSWALVAFTQGTSLRISDKLEIIKLSKEVYVHVSEGSNGMVIVRNGEGVIVSTPPTDEATASLLQWVQDSLGVRITACVIDSWHPDNMEGLDVVHRQGIKSYANDLTRTIAAAKGLPVPGVGFSGRTELTVGGKMLVLHYFGPAHTSDGIVVWIPDEQILFGGNAVRNFNGWVGNVGDANIGQWSQTIRKVKSEFGSAAVVVPGHGNCGGPELLDYTIGLYKACAGAVVSDRNVVKTTRISRDFGRIQISAERDSISGNAACFFGATVIVDKGDQYLVIESPPAGYHPDSRSVESAAGRLRIMNKSDESSLPEMDILYKEITVSLRDDAVGMTVIVRELAR